MNYSDRVTYIYLVNKVLNKLRESKFWRDDCVKQIMFQLFF